MIEVARSTHRDVHIVNCSEVCLWGNLNTTVVRKHNGFEGSSLSNSNLPF